MIPRISRLSVVILLCIPSAPTEDLHAWPPPWDGVRFRGSELGPQRLPHSDPAAKRAAGLNVGEPRTVRMVYFRSKDRPFRQELADAMKAVIDSTQTFYAEQMERHGYGYRTFRVETDAKGEAVVHNVVSKHPDISYASTSHLQNDALQNEIKGVFDSHKNILFVVADVSNWGASGWPLGKIGGIAQYDASTVLKANRAWYPGNYHFMVILHELGHAFGLAHDWRDGAYIMSYGPPGWDRLSACAAEFLFVHPYFNHDAPIEDTPARPSNSSHRVDILRAQQASPFNSTSPIRMDFIK